MLAPETLFAFISAALLVIAVPGPAMLMVLGQLRHSRVRAVAAVAGLVVGDLLLISAAGLGLATLLRQWPLLLTVLRWAGAAYVGWMGWAMLRAAPAAVAAPAAGGFRAALLLTLINPKPVLFFAAFFPLFLGAGPQPWLLGFLGLGLLFELLNIGFYALLIAAAGLLGARLGGAGRGAGLWLQRGGG
ncbi:LysE family translocator, partial [Paucibacter sp. XJ19-41]|uniref:LysE family translocator n=1 Tax=Paucibacter sp. XJ19-41 TaxID=2927824 RepID=UPI00234A89CA